MKAISFGPALLLLVSIASGEVKTITVNVDGSGDFKTVQEAIVAAPDKSTEITVIHIKPGTYMGQLIIPKTKTHLKFLGDDATSTIISWDRNVREKIPEGADKFNPGLQVLGDDFSAENLTFQNTSGDHGQALAVRADNDRSIFRKCRLVAWQDTLMVNNGRDYFEDCYIAGRVDFIYGSATAWFENCEIHSRNGGHVTAASTPQDHPFGFVFNKCKLTGDSIAWDPATTDPSTTIKARVTPIADLGRPWRAYGSVTFLNCEMGSHIKPEGWNNWGKASNETTARYSEYHSTGPGANVDKRAGWSHQLSDDAAKGITVKAVLSGKDGWDPTELGGK